MMPSEHPIREAFRASIQHALGPSQIEKFTDGLLAIDVNGKIVACGPYENFYQRLPSDCIVHDYRGFWIIPGFVDCHVHLPQLDCRNKTGFTLLDWLKNYIYPAEEKFADPKIASYVANRFYDALLQHGITTAAIYSTVHFEATDIAFQVAEEKGLRAVIGQVLMDQNAPPSLLQSASKSLRESEKLIAKWHGKNWKLFFAVTPRFALTCSKDLLDGAGRLAQEARVYFQTHLAETREEVVQARELHHFRNYPAFYEKLHCLGPSSLFAHSIYLEEPEWRLLGEQRCCVAHCPTSNVFLKSGTMSVAELEQQGIRYGLGTGVGGGPTFSMQAVMDCAMQVNPATMHSPKAFYLATLGGAEALSLSNQIGNFIPGKWGDFSIFENDDFNEKAKTVFVGGKRVFGSL